LFRRRRSGGRHDAKQDQGLSGFAAERSLFTLARFGNPASRRRLAEIDRSLLCQS
jgi:hypothetical protein